MKSIWIQVLAACQFLPWVVGGFVDYQLYKVWKGSGYIRTQLTWYIRETYLVAPVDKERFPK